MFIRKWENILLSLRCTLSELNDIIAPPVYFNDLGFNL